MPPLKVCPRCGDQYDASIAFCAKDGTRLIALGQTADLIGSVIAERYRITSRLGEGGMGQVFLAEHVRMKRRSAIKIMRPALVGDSEALQRFSREAENASQISHPNVASIFDFGETSDGLVYLAMEYVEGEPLSEKLAREVALHPDMAVDIIGQAADGLQAAHDLGILHRDLKPDNIMLGRRPDKTFLVKLVDFGIARTIDSEAQKVTRTGFAVGTPEFMSPEQLAGDVLDARSDQYSLALVAFIALTGKDAFPANTSKQSLIARLTSRPQTLQEAKQDVNWPEGLQLVFDKALAPDAIDRYDSISSFASELSTAISSMSPSQTAELYRFALRARLASVAQRTPQTDLQRIRTPHAPVPTTERSRIAEGAETGAHSGISDALVGASSGASSDPSASGARPAGIPPVAAIPVAGNHDTRKVLAAHDVVADADTTPRLRQPMPPARVLMIVGAVAVVTVGAWLAFGRGESTRETLSAAADSSAMTVSSASTNPPAPPTTAPIPPTPAGTPPGSAAPASPATPGAASAGGGATPPASGANAAGTASRPPGTMSGASASSRGSISSADSVRARQVRDSIRLARQRPPEAAAKRNAYPDSALKAALSGTPPEWKLFASKSNDIRVLAMSPVQLAWRNQQGSLWKSQHVRSDVGTPYDIVDPIEHWRAWSEIVRVKRPVIVLEVSPERVAFPAFAPSVAVDLKKGNVKSVEVTRDGVPADAADAERFPAYVSQEEQVRSKRAIITEVALTLSPDVFAPRPDGAPPRIEVSIIDADRRDAVKITLSDFVVRQMWADLAPFRALSARK